MPPFVVFSGVEALLNDQRAAKFDDAEPVVALLASRGVPLVLCSGRTRAELEYVQQGIGIADPFICEHGAAVFVRNGYFPSQLLGGSRPVREYAALEFGRPYTDVVDAVHEAAMKARAQIVSFAEMSIVEVAAAWGVPPLRARLAKLRDYEEGFRVIDGNQAARTRLWRQLQVAHLACVSDGIFDFAGPPVDLASGVQWLSTLYRRAHGRTVTIGLGDRSHHVPLLRRVDVPIIVGSEPEVTRRLFADVPNATLAVHRRRSNLVDLIAAVLERQSWIAAS